jgi:hypothetical protein
MVSGIKSKYFNCYWESMFISAMVYPDRIIKDNSDHIKKMKYYKQYYGSLKYILACRYCRDYTANVLEKSFPLNFSGRITLMKSLYTWKDIINKKLIKQGCDYTKPSPPFKEILEKYSKLQAKCDKKVGRCI